MDGTVADKLTPLIIDALTRGVVEPSGVPLFASRTDDGLFPNTAIGKAAAKKCQDEKLIAVTTSDGKDLATVSETGVQFLLKSLSPKEILEDFLRLLEQRRGEVIDLQASITRYAGTVEAMRVMIAQVLPQVVAERASMPKVMLNERKVPVLVGNRSGSFEGTETDTLAETIYTRLEQWSANASIARDYPLADLYESLSFQGVPSVGTFHDALRELHTDGRIYLHPWTGPLYSLPEPRMALLVGHEVAYYASIVK